MKKSKKILSVFLALMMSFSVVGGVTASAATQTDAEANAAEYNAIERDFSAVMGGTSEDKANLTAAGLNKVLVALFEKISLKAAVYSDSVATTVIKAIAGILKNDIANSVDANAIRADYPEAAEYLFTTCEGKWDNVDVNAVKWGIENREDFTKVIGIGTRNFGDTVNTLVALGPMFGTDVYNQALAPIIESLHVGKAKTLNDVMALGGGAAIMEYIANALCDAIDALAADPIGYLTAVLPDVANTFDPSIEILNGFLSTIGAMFGANFAVPNLNGIVALVAEKLGLTLTEVDVDALALMGTAKAAESGITDGYRMSIDGNKPVVFMALANYIKKNLENEANQKALGELIVEKTGLSSKEVFDALFDAIKADEDTTVTMEKLSKFVEDIAKAISGNGSENANPLVTFFAKIVHFFAMINARLLEFFNKFIKK